MSEAYVRKLRLPTVVASKLFRSVSSLPPGSAYILAVVADKGFSLLTIPLMAHKLSPASFGHLDVAVSVVEFIGIVMTLGIAETCIRFTASRSSSDPDRDGTAAEIFGAGFFFALLLGGVVQLFLDRIVAGIGVTAGPLAFRIAVAGACAASMVELPLVWLRLNGRGWRFLGFVGSRAALQAAATVTVLLMGGGVDGLLAANGSVALGYASALTASQIRQTGIRFTLTPIPLLARYGLPLVGGLLAMFVLGNCDRWFLAGRIPPAEIAYYGLAVKLGLVTAVFYQPFLLWWSARRLAILREEGPERLAIAWGQGAGLLLLAAIFVSLAAPSFIVAVFPRAYDKAADYVPLLVLISLLNELCSLSNTGVYATNHGFRVLAVNSAGAAAAITGYTLLIPVEGVMGAIEATIAAHLVRLCLFLWFGRIAAPIAYPWRPAMLAALGAAGSITFAPPPGDLWLRGLWLCTSIIFLAWAMPLLGLVSLPPFLERRLARLHIPLIRPRTVQCPFPNGNRFD